MYYSFFCIEYLTFESFLLIFVAAVPLSLQSFAPLCSCKIVNSPSLTTLVSASQVKDISEKKEKNNKPREAKLAATCALQFDASAA